MSKLATVQPATTAPPAAPRTMTAERWLAIYVLGAFAFLAVTRHAFREFIPR